MTNKEHLIEQHILEYESRMRHIDELYQRAHQAAGKIDNADEAQSRLDELAAQRALLQGPMAVWDILAQKLEDFVERHE